MNHVGVEASGQRNYSVSPLASENINSRTVRCPTQFLLAGFLALALTIPLGAQGRALTIPLSLDQLADLSATIVLGHVVGAKFEAHPDFPNVKTLLVTLRVQETFKGQPRKVFTFRQYVWDIRDRFGPTGYRKGQHMLLLMHAPSRSGLSSPVGLSQGRFRVLRDQQGNEYAINGHANVGLFRNMVPRLEKAGVHLSPEIEQFVKEHRSGAVQLKKLRDLIRAVLRTN